MSCDDYRAAISDAVDGASPSLDESSLGEHLAGCAACRDFAERSAELRRRTRVQAAPEMPDLTRRVVRSAAAADRAGAAWIARWLLALVAAQIIVLAVPDLFASGEFAHSARHLGAFSVAYAVGLIVVVVRPARARTMFHVALVLAAAMVVTAVVDIAQGRVPLVNEALHIPELFSVLFLWLLTRPRRAAAPDRPTALPDRLDDVVGDDHGLGDAPGASVHPLRPRPPRS